MIKTKLFVSEDSTTKPFITPAWQQHADLVSHLCEFSQNILLIIAPEGGGKTTFLKYFLERNKESSPHAVIKAENESVESFLKKIASGFHFKWHDFPTLFHDIQTGIEDDVDRKPWTLFIDDAHLLSKEQCQVLVKLIQFKEEQRQLHVVLLGEPSLELRLFSPDFSSLVHGKIYTIELESWTLSDVNAYLTKDLNAGRYTRSQIEEIFERSLGLPGKVVREKKTGEPMSKRPFRMFGVHPISLGVIVGVLVGGSYLLLNGTSEEEGNTNPTPMNTAQIEQTSTKPSTAVEFHFDKVDKSDRIEADMTDEPLTEVKAQEQTAVQAQAPQVQPPVQAQAPAPVQPQALVEAQAPAQVEAPIPTPVLEQTRVEAQAPVQASIKEKQTKPKKAAIRQSHLMSAEKPHYTLQLLGASKEDSVNKFILQHALKDKTQTFRTKRAGKDWYVVVYGNYSSKQEAKNAIQKMPASLKKTSIKPWVRDMQAVKDDIRQSNG